MNITIVLLRLYPVFASATLSVMKPYTQNTSEPRINPAKKIKISDHIVN